MMASADFFELSGSAHKADPISPFIDATEEDRPAKHRQPMHMTSTTSPRTSRPIHGAIHISAALAAALRQLPEPGRARLAPVALDLERAR